ncbi:MAG: hypothetical protein ABIB71_05325 [Candidatus Woesearchaeota archaeon]
MNEESNGILIKIIKELPAKRWWVEEDSGHINIWQGFGKKQCVTEFNSLKIVLREFKDEHLDTRYFLDIYSPGEEFLMKRLTSERVPGVKELYESKVPEIEKSYNPSAAEKRKETAERTLEYILCFTGGKK